MYFFGPKSSISLGLLIPSPATSVIKDEIQTSYVNQCSAIQFGSASSIMFPPQLSPIKQIPTGTSYMALPLRKNINELPSSYDTNYHSGDYLSLPASLSFEQPARCALGLAARREAEPGKVGAMQVAVSEQVKNTHPGTALENWSVYWKRGYLCPWGSGQGVWGTVFVAMYNWPGQGCWKILHLNTHSTRFGAEREPTLTTLISGKGLKLSRPFLCNHGPLRSHTYGHN